MFYRDISRALAFYLWILLLPLSIPLGIAIWCEWIIGPEVYPQLPSALAFILTMAITALVGLLLWWIGKKSTGHLYRREALLLVLIVYFLTPAIGGLPFSLNGTFSNPIDSYFEATSGLTTTGATIIKTRKIDPITKQELPIKKTFVTGEKTTYTYYGTVTPIVDGEKTYTGIESIGPALLFWRSFMQWLGGGGIIVLFIAILPALGVGGKILYQTEVTGPSKESMLPRIKETASQLWKIYAGLTICEIFFLKIFNQGEISLFNAITISLSTLSTGGFTPLNEGIAALNSVYADWVIMVFMILGSISFPLYFFCVRGKFKKLNDPELKLFLSIVLVVCILASWQLYGATKDPLVASRTSEGTYTASEAIRVGSFQAISAQTSTGFTTANYNLWPFSIQVLMLILFFIGGMAGSTAGGIKVIRQQTFFRIMLNKIESIYRPDTVREYRIGNTIIDNRMATTVLCFFLVAASLTILGTYFLVLDGIDPETSLTTISCMINNVGIAFRMGGPTESFAFLSNFGKLLCCVWMIAGRLEFFALLIAFVPAFWRST